MDGHVYILLNASMPGLLKIGITTLTPDERARQLSQETGIPSQFTVAYSEHVPDCRAAESLIHARLARYRVEHAREFFNLPTRDAIETVAQVANEIRKSMPVATSSGTSSQLRDCRGRFTSRSTSVSTAKGTTTEGSNEDAKASDSRPSSMPGPIRKASISVLTVLRKHFRGTKRTYLHPDIPPEKKRNAQRRYGPVLQPTEQVLLVYDGSWFGSADNGFIFTDRGIAWAESKAFPNYCSYLSIRPDEVCNGWTGFFVQGNKRADVFAADKEKVAAAMQRALHDLWRLRM